MNIENNLLSEVIGSKDAPIAVLFGGGSYRRDKVIRELSTLGDVTIYGTLSEEEGKAKIEELNGEVDLVLIGRVYTDEQRKRIKAWLAQKYPHIKLTQPGYDYPLSNDIINENFKKLLNL